METQLPHSQANANMSLLIGTDERGKREKEKEGERGRGDTAKGARGGRSDSGNKPFYLFENRKSLNV